MPSYPDISLLVTHYNRSKSLERLLSALEQLDLKFHEIVVSDDGSNAEHQAYITALQLRYEFSLVKAPINRGLGNNINKGQQYIKTPFTLYIQEDFVPKPLLAEKLTLSRQMMLADASIDFVRYYGYYSYPYVKPAEHGFNEMVFKHWKLWQHYHKYYYYSDHPHLRRSNFLERFGKYAEGVNPERAEYKMMMQVLANKPKALIYQDINALLTQVNDDEEPSTFKRNFLRNNNHFLSVAARALYRYLRFNSELLLFKIKRKIYGRSLV